MTSFNRLFCGFLSSEKWLNKRGAEKLLLVSVKDGKYTFVQCETPISYRIDQLDDSPMTEENQAYIQKLSEQGYKIAYIKGRTLYLYTEQENVPDYPERLAHMNYALRYVMLAWMIIAVLAFQITMYEIGQFELLSDKTFKSITPKDVAIVTGALTAVSVVFSVIYAVERYKLDKKRREVEFVTKSDVEVLVVKKLFFGYSDEEKWLNRMGEEKLLLTGIYKREYCFERIENTVKYFLDTYTDLPISPKSEAYLASVTEKGYKLAVEHGGDLYFYTLDNKKSDRKERFNNLIAHTKRIFVSCFSVALLACTVIAYRLFKTPKAQPLPNAPMDPMVKYLILPAVILLGFAVVYGYETYILNKKRKEVPEVVQTETDKTEADS